MTAKDLDQAINNYNKRSLRMSGTLPTLLGFGAAAAVGLVNANQVEADIVFNGAPAAGAQDLDGDGEDDINFGAFGSAISTFGFALVGVDATTGGLGSDESFGVMTAGGPGSFPYANQGAFSTGAASAGAVTDAPNGGWMGWASSGVVSTDAWGIFGNPGSTQTGYVGFRFNGQSAGGATVPLFGWALVGAVYNDVDGSGGPNTGDTIGTAIFAWAYQDDPTSTDHGDGFSGAAGGIHVGAIANTVPEPTTATGLALLALGAAGLRRRKQLVA